MAEAEEGGVGGVVSFWTEGEAGQVVESETGGEGGGLG